MATRSEDASDQPQQQPIETAKQAGGMDREGEVEVEGKAPVHDASSAGIKAPVVAQAQAQTKAELSKVADTLRDDAKEGTTIDDRRVPQQHQAYTYIAYMRPYLYAVHIALHARGIRYAT